MDELALSLIFFAVAIVGGAINAVAGGGTFLLFPTLMFGGLSPVAANVMCTIAMWPGSISSAYTYWREVKMPMLVLKKLIIVALLGSTVGVILLLKMPESVFESLIPWLLLIATLVFVFGRRIIALFRLEHRSINPIAIYASMFFIAIYGGYFGAGIGILMLAMLQLYGFHHMHEANGLKTVLGTAINAVSVIIFIVSNAVTWEWAGVLIAGGITGGYLGTKLALKLHPEKVRAFVSAIAIGMTAYFFIKGA